MQIIPAVDVLGGRVVRLMHGNYDAVTHYADDPVATARRWHREGADLVHLVDLAGARSGRPDVAMWEAMGRSGVPFQVGGGVRSVELASTALELGARRVVMGSAAVWEPKILGDLIARYGTDRVVAALDVRGDKAQGAGWTDEGRSLNEVLSATLAAGCDWVLATGIARDGTMKGPDLGLLRRIRAIGPDLAIIGSGGVGALAHLQELRDAGASAVVVGRALYEGAFSLAAALDFVGADR